jgi:hypothetical protein
MVGPEISGLGVPAAIAHHPLLAGSSQSGGATIARIGVVLEVPAILGPLPDIAVDIIKAPGIGAVAVDGDCLADRLPVSPPAA